MKQVEWTVASLMLGSDILGDLTASNKHDKHVGRELPLRSSHDQLALAI